MGVVILLLLYLQISGKQGMGVAIVIREQASSRGIGKGIFASCVIHMEKLCHQILSFHRLRYNL